MTMRVVTRPDFDGVVCAVLLHDVESISASTLWVEPKEIQTGRVITRDNDIIANLPLNRPFALWFDHHGTNVTTETLPGAFDIVPSAAGLIYTYYRGRFSRDFQSLVHQTDRIDAADLTEDEVRRPQKYPYVLLSMTINGGSDEALRYCDRLVELLGRYEIEQVMQDRVVAAQCRATLAANDRFEQALREYTQLEGQVAVTDFRQVAPSPTGNRYLVYVLFPESVVHMRIRYDDPAKDRVAVSVGHNIFNSHCRVNIGVLLSRFGGGGHYGAGGCVFDADKADDYLACIRDALVKNELIE
jgi:hypothetical protein